VECWKQATQGGKQWERELALVKKEYSDFSQIDPLYLDGIRIILPLIKANPGILQTDLYDKVEIMREHVSYILYFAAENGVIERTKKGRSYQIRVI
jgi:predicted transcriptional regulator